MRALFWGLLAVSIALVTSTNLKSDDKCQLIFDAGSSGTRLYAYENSNNELKEVFSDPIEIDVGISWALREETMWWGQLYR